MKRRAKFDAPFWAVLVGGIFLAGALSCLGIAAFAQADGSQIDMEVLTSDDLPPGGPAALRASAN